MREGNWVFLANCHLMTSWLPTLDKIIEGLEGHSPHDNFRQVFFAFVWCAMRDARLFRC
jgi:hypothetical protein